MQAIKTIALDNLNLDKEQKAALITEKSGGKGAVKEVLGLILGNN